MGLVSSSTKNSIITRDLQRVAAAGRKAFASHRRFADRLYLRKVYCTYRKWRKDGCAKRRCRRLSKTYSLRRDLHPLRVIIECTTPEQDRRIKSRWVRALQFAASQNVASGNLEDFLNRCGGIAGCARGSAARQRPARLSWRPKTVIAARRTVSALNATHRAKSNFQYSTLGHADPGW